MPFKNLMINLEWKQDLLYWLSRRIDYPLVPPQRMQISLTYRCNLRCRMCRLSGMLPVEDELSAAQLLRIIEEAASFGIGEILFTGGEPFLRGDIFELCGYAAGKKIRPVVTTNGTIINEDLAEKIAGSGIGHVHFSLDGLESANDIIRGRGSFQKALRGMRLLAEKRTAAGRFSLGIACTVMEENVEDLFCLLKLADDLGVDAINFQPLVRDNACFSGNGNPAFWLRREKIGVLKEQIGRIKQYRPRHVRIYEEPELELLIRYYEEKLTKKDWTCFGGFKTVFICFDKRKPLVYSCHGVCGDLDKTSLREAWNSRQAHELRLYSRRCRNLCLQSCYSQSGAHSLMRVIAGRRQGIRRG